MPIDLLAAAVAAEAAEVEDQVEGDVATVVEEVITINVRHAVMSGKLLD